MRDELKRLGQLGALAGDSIRQRREEVVDRLASLRGLPQKIGQFLSLSELEALGTPDGNRSYVHLTEGPPVMSAEEAWRELELRIGRPIATVFRTLEERGVAASFGQVHKGTLWDGRVVAIKMKLPNIAESIKVDLSALGLLTAPIGGWRRGFDTAGYRRELASALCEELDYTRELTSLVELRRLTTGWREIVLPEPIAVLSNEHVLVMTWIDGDGFEAVRGWPASDRQAVGTAMLRWFLSSCLSFGLLHADPHPGNYRFLRHEGVQLGVLDFGCVRRLPNGFSRALRYLIAEARAAKERRADLLDAYVTLGFGRELLEPMVHLLPALTRALFEPFCTSGPFSMADWSPGERAAAVLGDYRHNFRFAGSPPLLFVIRAFRGLVAYLRALAVPIDWSRVYDEISNETMPIGGMRIDSLRCDPIGKRTAGGASVLRVRLSEDERMKVDLTFRAAMVEHLADIMPDELGPKLVARGIDIDALARTAVSQGIVPRELFRLDEDNREIRVWLE